MRRIGRLAAPLHARCGPFRTFARTWDDSDGRWRGRECGARRTERSCRHGGPRRRARPPASRRCGDPRCPPTGARGSSGCSPTPTTRCSASAAPSPGAPRRARSPAIASLTQGEAGPDPRRRRRRRGGRSGPCARRSSSASASALGVDHVMCLDLGDGRLAALPIDETRRRRSATLIDEFAPDVVVTFGPDGGFGHPDHVVSCLATLEAVRSMAAPPRLLHAKFPMQGQLMVDMIVDVAQRRSRARFRGSAGVRPRAQAVRRRHVDARRRGRPRAARVVPAGVVHHRAGRAVDRAVLHPVGHRRRRRRARRRPHAVAGHRRCRVLRRRGRARDRAAPERPRDRPRRGDLPRARRRSGRARRRAGAQARRRARRQDPVAATAVGGRTSSRTASWSTSSPRSNRKVAALAAHRSQYALEPDLLPQSMLERLLGTEHFVVAAV